MPTSEHVIFIPVVLLVGLAVGYVLGGRAAQKQAAERARRRKE